MGEQLHEMTREHLTILVTLNLSGTDNADVTDIVTTDSNGIAAFTYSSAKAGNTYTSTVTNVSKSGFTYDSSSNLETSDSITIYLSSKNKS